MQILQFNHGVALHIATVEWHELVTLSSIKGMFIIYVKSLCYKLAVIYAYQKKPLYVECMEVVCCLSQNNVFTILFASTEQTNISMAYQ